MIELLRDIDGILLAMAFPVWDPVTSEYVREVLHFSLCLYCVPYVIWVSPFQGVSISRCPW